MPTMSLELTATLNERLARRRVGDRFYAGLPCSGLAQQIQEIAAGATLLLTTGAPVVSLVAAVDPDTEIFIGWTPLGGELVEIPLMLLAVLSPPTEYQSLQLRNGAATGTAPVPVSLLLIT